MFPCSHFPEYLMGWFKWLSAVFMEKFVYFFPSAFDGAHFQCKNIYKYFKNTKNINFTTGDFFPGNIFFCC